MKKRNAFWKWIGTFSLTWSKCSTKIWSLMVKICPPMSKKLEKRILALWKISCWFSQTGRKIHSRHHCLDVDSKGKQSRCAYWRRSSVDLLHYEEHQSQLDPFLQRAHAKVCEVKWLPFSLCYSCFKISTIFWI